MKLLPCPFCGGQGKIINTSHMDDSIYSVICSTVDGDMNCWATIAPESSWWRTKNQAVKAWNTRFPKHVRSAKNENSLPKKIIVCKHQTINPSQLCYECRAYNQAIDDCETSLGIEEDNK